MNAPIRRGTARRLGIRRARRGPDAYRVLVDEVDLTAFVRAVKLPLDDWPANALYHVTTPDGTSVVEGINDRYRRAGFDARFTWNDGDDPTLWSDEEWEARRSRALRELSACPNTVEGRPGEQLCTRRFGVAPCSTCPSGGLPRGAGACPHRFEGQLGEPLCTRTLGASTLCATCPSGVAP